MELKEEDYNKLMFNVYSIKKNDKLAIKFPVLKIYKELAELEPNVFKFVVLLFDPNSPLNIIESYNKKLIEAAMLSEFPVETETSFEEDYQKIVEFKDTKVNKAILRYCRITKDVDYSELKVYEIAFYNELKNMLTEEDATKRAKTIENISALKEKIKELQAVFFNKNNNPVLELNLMDLVESEELGLRPEEIALKQFNGEQMLKFDYYA